MEICNYCGKEMDLYDTLQSFTIHRMVGYGSVHDGETVNLRLCCECFDKIVGGCKVSPITKESDVNEFDCL